MLAQGHDGRTVIGCTFGPGALGEWMPLAGPGGLPVCDPSPWVAYAKPFVLKSPSQFRNADVQAANLGAQVERYVQTHLFASQ